MRWIDFFGNIAKSVNYDMEIVLPYNSMSWFVEESALADVPLLGFVLLGV